MAKRCLGFPTKKEARAAIQVIAWMYNPGQEFFHPLLQQLFLEQPYWCDPPGPRFIRFKWASKPLPNGAPNDRHFMGYSADTGWVSVSYQKALRNKRLEVVDVLTDFARGRVMSIVTEYRARNPRCAHCERPAADVHHDVALADIIYNSMLPLTREQETEIMAQYTTWRGIHSFTLPDSHPFTAKLLNYHNIPGVLVSLCKEHHNAAHGKKTHIRKDDQGGGEAAPA